MRILLVLIAGALFAVGCGATDEPAGPGGQGAADPSEPTMAPSSPSATPTPSLSLGPSASQPTASQPLPPPPGGGPAAIVPPALLEQVLADAANRTGVPRSAVGVVGAQAQTWNDGSLGCPEPGMGYVQVVTEGYQIMVSAGGTTLDYRTSTNGAIKVCGPK